MRSSGRTLQARRQSHGRDASGGGTRSLCRWQDVDDYIHLRIDNSQLTIHNCLRNHWRLAKDNYNTNCSFGKYKIVARYVQDTSKVHPRYIYGTSKQAERYMEAIQRIAKRFYGGSPKILWRVSMGRETIHNSIIYRVRDILADCRFYYHRRWKHEWNPRLSRIILTVLIDAESVSAK